MVIFIFVVCGSIGYLLIDQYLLKMKIRDLEEEILELSNKK